MDLILNFFAHAFGQYTWENLMQILTPTGLGIIATLVVLEGLLSVDNALVLAVMVRGLPEEKQKKALTYGIWGAYAFRFIAIAIGTMLVKFSIVKFIGGAYLLYLAIHYFYSKHGVDDLNNDNVVDALQRGFWMTVASIELMDIAFSADSVLAAFGLSENVWILLLGGMLGILMMRNVAKLFVALLAKIPELETSAYLLIAIIGGKMIAATFHYEMSHTVFFILLAVIFGGTIALHYLKKSQVVSERV